MPRSRCVPISSTATAATASALIVTTTTATVTAIPVATTTITTTATETEASGPFHRPKPCGLWRIYLPRLERIYLRGLSPVAPRGTVRSRY
jgi:voltage-gated potassium channel Kch